MGIRNRVSTWASNRRPRRKSGLRGADPRLDDRRHRRVRGLRTRAARRAPPESPHSSRAAAQGVPPERRSPRRRHDPRSRRRRNHGSPEPAPADRAGRDGSGRSGISSQRRVPACRGQGRGGRPSLGQRRRTHHDRPSLPTQRIAVRQRASSRRPTRVGPDGRHLIRRARHSSTISPAERRTTQRKSGGREAGGVRDDDVERRRPVAAVRGRSHPVRPAASREGVRSIASDDDRLPLAAVVRIR